MQIPIVNRFIVFNFSHLDGIEDPILRAKVYSYITTECFHGKTTASRRFSDIDKITLRYLRKMEDPVIHDIAVSSGITSCDLLREIKAAGIQADYCISDKYSLYYSTGKRFTRIYDANKKFLYGYIFSLLAKKTDDVKLIGSKVLYYLLKIMSTPDNNYKKVLLLDGNAVMNINNGNFTFIEYDVLSSIIKDKFTYVRCMNLLNRYSWLGDDEICIALRNIKTSLKENGIMQIGKTEDGTGVNNVSIFKKTDDKFVLLEHINAGSELIDIINLV